MQYPDLPRGVTIRRLMYADHAQVRSFKCANENEPHTADVEKLIQTKLLRSQSDPAINCHVLVAVTKNGQLVGVNAVVLTRDPPEFADNWLLAVSPQWRRRYIGLNLKLAAIDLCMKEGVGVEALVSMVSKNNQAMRRLNNNWLQAVSEPDADDPANYLAVVVAFDSSGVDIDNA